jgi:hypothetical protein
MPKQWSAILGGKALDKRLDISSPFGAGISHGGKLSIMLCGQTAFGDDPMLLIAIILSYCT